jgi:hypothetical protein
VTREDHAQLPRAFHFHGVLLWDRHYEDRVVGDGISKVADVLVWTIGAHPHGSSTSVDVPRHSGRCKSLYGLCKPRKGSLS